MANPLDELTDPVSESGNDVNVIHKQLPVTVGFESILFELFIYCVGFVPALVMTLAKADVETPVLAGAWVAGIIPGAVYFLLKIQAKNFFLQLQQRLQSQASEIDNYLEQRVVILENVAGLVSKAVDLDKEVMTRVAALRSGLGSDGTDRSEFAGKIDAAFTNLVPRLEAYPELKAHEAISEALRQNSYLQKEITAARTLYNDTVNTWNREIYSWPVKQIVAARANYTTRIPFAASREVKERARAKVF
ncbi:MAG: LemA family protein [Lentisphaeria bacterium]|nr:LemA family protein [Lentisphaeria bacterium]